ncbi:4a-hydroxytetrahydrobiopterin dehydratase [Flavobacterium capsici]|uniref:4a-hydroxytetrahydrobiopterin dehydratase n=1 Tax=Flavobacterium capsici TaxID=3075618 RepID=A0AA96J898_9FLAO|nr:MULTISPECIES: 4a-hydroxytetrahydrobiopterin dehydratase [unclassified Flavobacterium]WNM19139.1 4a-hydroxytetrahydrobiopterin dehydratase [Flavobacterium sp. PMR2A8]WNM20528.1 4a-hydroxytetrahydrobiopterin dehydratase [Flavobacterium sp. PMTSA4]
MIPYTNAEIVESLMKAKDWNYVNECLEKQFLFEDFNQALGFILKVGILAEKQNHHPEINNVYNKVTLRIYTHDANGITDKDFKLANSIDKL